MRRSFAQVLKEGNISIRREYDKLFALLHEPLFSNSDISLFDVISKNITRLPFRGTCLSLEEFDEKYGFNFVKKPEHVDVDYLIAFCEYMYNLVTGLNNATIFSWDGVERSINYSNYLSQINAVIEELGYVQAMDGFIYIFVEKSPAAIAVSESDTIPDELSFRVLEYNHQKLRGDLEQKKQIILQIASIIEAKEKSLLKIAPGLKDNLSFALNNLNLRHNNVDKEGKNYRKQIDEMDRNELEKLYDYTYQMCLLAIMELDYKDNKEVIESLKRNISNN